MHPLCMRTQPEKESKKMRTDCTYIVTGCTGFVGNVLTKKLLQEGCRVIGFARSRKKAETVFPDQKPEFVFGDIKNRADVEKLFEADGPYIVLHTVAKVTIGEGDAKELYDVTVQGTKTVVECSLAHGAEKFIHISSTEALPRGVRSDENLRNYRPQPKTSRKGYAKAKATADAVVLQAFHEHGLNAGILFLSSVLGPGDYSIGHMSQMFIDFVNGKLPASVRDGYNDFDIRDLAQVLPQIVERAEAGEGYIFANRPDRIDEILGYVADFTGKKRPPALPVWLAYVGLPFLFLYAKVRKKRPLYTRAALAALREDADFPIRKTCETFGFSPRPLQETVVDHVRFLAQIGKIKLEN